MVSLVRFTTYAAASLAVAGAAGLVPTRNAAGDDGVAALGLAALLTLCGAVVGYLPVARAEGASLERRAQAALVGMVLRLFATLGGAFLLPVAGLVAARTAFLVWVAVDYAVLLALETWVLATTVGRSGRGASA